MPTTLFDKIVDKDNIYKAYKKVLKGKNKYSTEAIEFVIDETYNLKTLRQSLIDETYRFDGYIRFMVYEPKERIIDAPHFKDKIVQLAVNKVLKEVYQPCFIYDSYASLDEKGTHKCVDRIQYFMREAKQQYGESAYIVKMDIKKFFYSIDREILKNFFSKKIKCKKTLRLLYHIIDSAKLINDKGLPLGNTLSQISANIYLNKLDQFCKRKLSLKYMVRYMDDVIIIVENKEKAQEVKELICDFVKQKLNLEHNKDKTDIFPINQGVNAIGFKIHTTHKLLRNDCKKKIKGKLRAMPELIILGKLTINKAEQMLNSWLGHAKHGNSYNFIQSLLKRFNFIYLDKKDRLRIDIDKLNKYVENKKIKEAAESVKIA